MGECLGGCLYLPDFIQLAKEAGFLDVRVVNRRPIDVSDERLKRLVGRTTFESITLRLFKLPEMDATGCEDYGQCAKYLGYVECDC